LEVKDEILQGQGKIVVDLTSFKVCLEDRLREHPGYDATRHASLIDSLVDSSIDCLKDMKVVLLVKSWIVLDPNWMTSKVLGTIAKTREGKRPREWDQDKINKLADDAASLFFGGDTSSLPMILQVVGAVILVHRSAAATSAAIAEDSDAAANDGDASTGASAAVHGDVGATASIATESSDAAIMKCWFPVFLDDREAIDVDIFSIIKEDWKLFFLDDISSN
jgi:hypothetical protein